MKRYPINVKINRTTWWLVWYSDEDGNDSVATANGALRLFADRSLAADAWRDASDTIEESRVCYDFDVISDWIDGGTTPPSPDDLLNAWNLLTDVHNSTHPDHTRLFGVDAGGPVIDAYDALFSCTPIAREVRISALDSTLRTDDLVQISRVLSSGIAMLKREIAKSTSTAARARG
jgi:hypothetical protein